MCVIKSTEKRLNWDTCSSDRQSQLSLHNVSSPNWNKRSRLQDTNVESTEIQIVESATALNSGILTGAICVISINRRHLFVYMLGGRL